MKAEKMKKLKFNQLMFILEKWQICFGVRKLEDGIEFSKWYNDVKERHKNEENLEELYEEVYNFFNYFKDTMPMFMTLYGFGTCHDGVTKDDVNVSVQCRGHL